MFKVGITGISGFIGWHLRCLLQGQEDVEVLPADREIFTDNRRADRFVREVSVVVHLAGMNRGGDDELEGVNVALAQALTSAFERTGVSPQVIFSSSTHADRDTPYGRSKRRATEIFRRWAEANAGVFTNFILPHVFGEGGRPFYNSAVATFCHQVANSEHPKVFDAPLELVHVQDVAGQMLAVIRNRIGGEIRVKGVPISVSALLEKIRGLAKDYDAHIVPDLRDQFTLRLFNTYRSYLFPARYPVPVDLHGDSRGLLFEAVKSRSGGQSFVSTTKPGVTRGNHYHLAKVERFLVIQGDAVIRLRRLFDDRVIEFRVSGSKPAFVDIPTLYTHNISNVGGQDLLTLFWSNEIFDLENPDTYRERV